MPLVSIRHVLPNGRTRWLEGVLPADDADVVVWGTDPANAVVFDLPSALRDDLLAQLGERVLQGTNTTLSGSGQFRGGSIG